jgi:hypothetical protein
LTALNLSLSLSLSLSLRHRPYSAHSGAKLVLRQKLVRKTCRGGPWV